MIKAYLTAELLLLIAVKAGDLIGLPAFLYNILAFSAIFLNAVIAFIFLRASSPGRPRTRLREDLIAGALFLTLAGDVFLTLIGTEDVFVPGIVFFCLTQTVYAAYLGPSVLSVCLQALLAAGGIFLLHGTGNLTAASALGALDLALLSVNVLTAWTGARTRAPLLFKIGITLFFLCDASIGLRMVTAGPVRDAAAFMVWVFYAPSQTAITLAYGLSVLMAD